MYYSNGNYEAFARPKKPEGIENKSAYIVGLGLAGLSAACFLVRDAQMPGKNIHMLERLPVAGGSCDGILDNTRGWVMRGGREMDNHFEVMWDLYRSIPSIEDPEVSVLDEYYWLNKEDPNFSLCRATVNCGEDAHTDRKFNMTPGAAMQLLKIFMTPDRELEGKTMDEFFDDEFYATNFWLYWQTMFAFEKWHSALEMKLYVQRFIHHIGGLPDFKALRFTRYNQYESMILPMIKYLEDHGVTIEYGVDVKNIIFDITEEKKVAKRIEYIKDGKTGAFDLTENDLVFYTNGCHCDCSIYGDQDTAPIINIKDGEGDSWDLWRKIADQDPSFGHPDVFCSRIKDTKWESATITVKKGPIIDYIMNICKRDPFSGRVVTGGIVTVKDSKWLMSWTINRQQQFRAQPKDEITVWVYGLFGEEIGDFVKKPMEECTGKEICMEWLYHIGVPTDKIEQYASECNTVPVQMPYVTAFFQPRKSGDRPQVVPEGCVNIGFLGQFAETVRDTVFTTEYSMRTAMEAVYTLCNVDRAVPEVYGSVYDVRCLTDATVKLLDGQKPLEFLLPTLVPILALVKDKIENNVVTDFLKLHNVL